MDGWTIAEGLFLILLGIVIALKLARPTVINNYAPKAEAYADSGGAGTGLSGLAVVTLIRVGALVVVLMVALAIISAITNVATSATDAISESARPVVVEAPAPVPMEVPAPTSIPVQVPVPSSVPVEQPGLGNLFFRFLSAGGWIPSVLIIVMVLLLTRSRGKRTASPSPTTVYYPPRRESGQGIPIEDVPLFSGREKSER